jgi:hypothetical protein
MRLLSESKDRDVELQALTYKIVENTKKKYILYIYIYQIYDAYTI